MKGYLIGIIFIIGLALGIAGMFYGPKYLGKYMPGFGSFGAASGKPVEGRVVAKLPHADKLLITVSTADGASLVTFNQKVDEISLLVDVGDHITLKMGKYKPFVTNPAIVSVKKESPEFGGASSSVTPPADLSTNAPKNEEPVPQTPEMTPEKQGKKPEMKKAQPENIIPQPQESPAKKNEQKI